MTGIVFHRIVLPRATTNDARADRGVTIAASLRLNLAKWPELDPTPDQLDALNKTVADRKKEVKNRVGGAGTRLNKALRTLDNGLEAARAVVQKHAHASPDDTATLAALAGMALAKEPGPRKPKDPVTQGAASSTADGHVHPAPPRFAVEWEGTPEGAAAPTIHEVTDMADIHFTGLTPGLIHAFRYRLTIRGVKQDWSQVFAIRIA